MPASSPNSSGALDDHADGQRGRLPFLDALRVPNAGLGRLRVGIYSRRSRP